MKFWILVSLAISMVAGSQPAWAVASESETQYCPVSVKQVGGEFKICEDKADLVYQTLPKEIDEAEEAIRESGQKQLGEVAAKSDICDGGTEALKTTLKSASAQLETAKGNLAKIDEKLVETDKAVREKRNTLSEAHPVMIRLANCLTDAKKRNNTSMETNCRRDPKLDSIAPRLSKSQFGDVKQVDNGKTIEIAKTISESINEYDKVVARIMELKIRTMKSHNAATSYQGNFGQMVTKLDTSGQTCGDISDYAKKEQEKILNQGGQQHGATEDKTKLASSTDVAKIDWDAFKKCNEVKDFNDCQKEFGYPITQNGQQSGADPQVAQSNYEKCKHLLAAVARIHVDMAHPVDGFYK